MKQQTFDRLATMFLISVLAISIWAVCVYKNPLEASFKHDCYRLQDHAEQYKNFLYSHNNTSGFYVTQKEAQFCMDLGIEIKAPIKY